MYFSSLFAPTLKDDPSDAEVVSHKLLVRAGMIRQVARGIYDYLPLGLRVLRNIEKIVRSEMDKAGAQELMLPVICPAELWQESRRWDAYGKDLLRLKDRHERDFLISPTHEELVTDVVRNAVRSYRELPMNLYQIQTKFRDEIRPRFGLMRGREFIMKDAYSFHADRADCEREYQHMYETYDRIFTRCGLEFRAVEADTGEMGGSLSHEFQVLASSGEDEIAVCNSCGYAANVERAELGPSAPDALSEEASAELRNVATPDCRTIEDVSSYLDLPVDRLIKTLIYETSEGNSVAALLRGDQTLSEAKLRAALGCDWIRLATADTVQKVTGAQIGFAGPVGLQVQLVADQSLHGVRNAAAGANRDHEHVVGVEHDRDFGDNVSFADLRQARKGDPCAKCGGGAYEFHRGIEVGQVFYLGTKYSDSLGATFLDAEGKSRTMEMGCYGIGVSRTMAAAVEQNHDENGIIWPLAIAPYPIQIIPISLDDEAVRATSESIEHALADAGLEALIDDRDERPGIKFKDADLIGIPWRLTIGKKGLDRGIVELKSRKDGSVEELPVEEAAQRIMEKLT